MVKFIRALGRITLCQDRESSGGLMEDITLASSLQTRRMGEE
jgi:hypothetical protein